MQRICAWCNKDMGETPSVLYLSQEITHGMCDDCVKKMLCTALCVECEQADTPTMIDLGGES